MRKAKVHNDQNKMSMQKKGNSMPWYNYDYKEAKKLMKKARGEFIYALNSLTHSNSEYGIELWYGMPISEYGIELWGFKGLSDLEKNIHVHLYKFILSVKQSTAENFDYGELGRQPCQFRVRWRQVKFWNRLIGLPQHRLVNNALKVAFRPFQQQFIH